MDHAGNWQLVFNYEFKEQYLRVNDAQILISGEELRNFPYVKRQRCLFIC